jgi:hypothetical protein
MNHPYVSPSVVHWFKLLAQVGSILGTAANLWRGNRRTEEACRVLEIFPTLDEMADGGGHISSSMPRSFGDAVVQYVEASDGKTIRGPAQITDVTRNSFTFRRPPSAPVRHGLRPPLLCKCCRALLVPTEHHAVWTVDPRAIAGFDEQYWADEEVNAHPSLSTRPLAAR